MLFGNPYLQVQNSDRTAELRIGDEIYQYDGNWVFGNSWERFGQYNQYVIIRDDFEVARFPAHAGELIPGSTEDLIAAIKQFDPEAGRPFAPMQLDVDPTYRCYSKDCGGHCFSAAYRARAPSAQIPSGVLADIMAEFAGDGGRIIRFDGGGDPLAHPAIRNGYLPELASRLQLKSAVLTSGDAFQKTDFERIGGANCYLRISLNAATDQTRQVFHGNKMELSQLFRTIEKFSSWLARNNPGLPIGATYLLSHMNYHEVYQCAILAKNSGINHFSVRRILGPHQLRPVFTERQLSELKILLDQTRALATNDFRVFVPWRPIHQSDLNPSQEDFVASYCWQSTFKTVIEPSINNESYQAQLCGRYRGSGIGQEMQLPSLFSLSDGKEWLAQWRKSFTDYEVSRKDLPTSCSSCIDRGFINMVENLIKFVELPDHDFEILHLNSTSADQDN